MLKAIEAVLSKMHWKMCSFDRVLELTDALRYARILLSSHSFYIIHTNANNHVKPTKVIQKVHIIESFCKYFLKVYFPDWIGGLYWIGLNDMANERDWRWEHNGEVPSFTPWMPGEPWGLRDSNCVVVTAEALWDDVACSDLWPKGICEFVAAVWSLPRVTCLISRQMISNETLVSLKSYGGI